MNSIAQSFDRNARISQRDLLPTAVQNRNFGQIISFSGVSSASTTLTSAQQVVFTVTTATKNNGTTLCVADLTLYMDTQDASHQIPGGSSVDMSQWQVIFLGNDYRSSDGNNTKTLIYVRNISAGSHTVTLVTQSRVIQNSNLT